MADAVGSFQQLLIGDPLVAALDGDFRPAAFLDVAIHEVCGDIERFRQGDQEIGHLQQVRGRAGRFFRANGREYNTGAMGALPGAVGKP